MSKTTTKKNKVAEVTKAKYMLLITSRMGIEMSTDTNNLAETISLFKPLSITGKIIVRVTKGSRTYERVLFAPIARRTFYNDFALNLFARNIEKALL